MRYATIPKKIGKVHQKVAASIAFSKSRPPGRLLGPDRPLADGRFAANSLTLPRGPANVNIHPAPDFRLTRRGALKSENNY